MNVNMIRELANQHKALKAFHTLCRRNGATLSVSTTCPDDSQLLSSPIAALIIPRVNIALLERIRETEKAIQENANG